MPQEPHGDDLFAADYRGVKVIPLKLLPRTFGLPKRGDDQPVVYNKA